MFELTRRKLETVAARQTSGRRGAPSLRELVLLSNVWGTIRPQWAQEQEEKEREQVEELRRRSEDEQKWLELVMDEMLEDADDDEEDWVGVTLRDEGEVEDSGFLDGERKDRAQEVLQRIVEDDEEEEEQAPDCDDDAEPTPTSPPRSPPIAVPSLSLRHPPSFSLLASSDLEDDDVFSSASPPLDPPPLTPDSSPPTQGGLATDFLTSSYDSLLDHELDSWIQGHELSQHHRLGLLSVDRTPPTKSSINLDIVSLSLQPFSPSSTTYDVPLPPSRSTSLALVRSSTHTSPDPSLWTPRPPRSLSLPNLRQSSQQSSRPSTPPPSIPSFTSGIVKDFYDCVEYALFSLSRLFLADANTPLSRSFGQPSLLSSSPTPISSSRDDSLALVLARPRPLHPPTTYSFLGTGKVGEGASWRSRSSSPDHRQSSSSLKAQGRRPRLSDVTSDAED